MPKVKICDPSALGKGKSGTKPQMNNRKKKQLEDKIIELFGICLTFAEVKKVIGLQDYTWAETVPCRRRGQGVGTVQDPGGVICPRP